MAMNARNGTGSMGLRTLLAAAGLGGAAVLGGLMGGCETNATTGRNQFIMMSWAQEAQLGAEAQPQLVQEMGGEVSRADLRQYVTEVGQKLAATTAQDDPNLPSLPWEFTLLDSDVINAFALPGGKVFMSRGLAQMMTNEAQLAGVLGHEIGHVTARHGNERFSRAAGAQLGLGVLGVAVGSGAEAQMISDLAGQATELALLGYSRSQELESDKLGMEYMARAGYNPAAQRDVMEILLKAAGSGGQPEFFSTHPHPESRIAQINDLLVGKYSHTQNNPQYKLGEQEFRQRFLSKLALAYPSQGTPRFDPEEARRQREVAMREAGVTEHAGCDDACGH
jgi:predicted Zn-dependent protease